MTKIDPRCSPCRRHPCSVEHADLVRTFRSLAEDWRRAAERATGGYEREMRLFVESHPRPTLKPFLVASRRQREDDEVLSDEGRAA
ncbi:MAG TPA: hypothetical protein VGX25_06775 [Actinophytocola sp.]|uniref:hypothetical protein n=1 Tax=Actinophytocola sp. TaxID=1872138 RepID=UPI002DDD624C|nr:hypothetical protein [Actinophytocola sp.]HEV2779092.1 hypothetical protein [Actinophytocola sp.]